MGTVNNRNFVVSKKIILLRIRLSQGDINTRSLNECSNVKKLCSASLCNKDCRWRPTRFPSTSDPYSDILTIQLKVTLYSPFWSSELLVSKTSTPERYVFCLSCISSVVLPVWTPAQIANIFLSACVREEW